LFTQLKGDCDDDTPPNHKLFETKGNRQLAPLSLLQRRAAANQPAHPPAPVINNIFPEALMHRLLNPNAVAEVPAALLGAHHPPPLHHEPMLLPPNMKVGAGITIPAFCDLYDLDPSIRDKFHAHGFKNADVFYLVKLSELKEMDFKVGEIAELQNAVRQWAVSL
jgi:hypothetical protein